MAYTKKIKAGLVPVSTEEFIGDAGTIFYDPDVGDLHLSDGVTPGGTLLSSTNGNGDGYTGSQGTNGYTGSQGIIGVIGYTGSEGIQGNIGYTGSQGTNGYTGSTGYVGSAGATGASGISGYTGSAGADGTNGASGATGPTGYAGSAGTNGASGANGDIGATGLAGYTGSAGTNGSNGVAGYTGSVGNTGSTGYTGSFGNIGYTGSQGIRAQEDRLVSGNIEVILGTTGNLTLPGSIIGTATIGIDNRDSGTTADIQLYSADDILIQARDRTIGSTSEGGDINIFAGDSAEDSDTSAGDIVIEAGAGGASNLDYGGAGGFVRVEAGQGGAAVGANFAARSGGDLTLRAGDAGTNNGNIDLGNSGGDVIINAGDSTGNGNPGGTIYLTSGAADASGLAGDVVIQAGGTWTFDGNGDLTLPAGGTITEGGGLTGAIKLKPAGGANDNQALLIYPTAAADGDHVHLTAAGGTTELYLGNDYHYVKLVDGGNIELRATTANLFSQASWNFDITGNIDARQVLGIKVPNGVPSVVATINSSSVNWMSNPMSNLATTGGSGSGLRVNVNSLSDAADIISIATPGTGYLNGELITVTSGSSSATFTIVIAGRNSWLFDSNGDLVLPGNLVIAGNTSIFGTNASLIQTTNGLPLLSLSSGSNGGVSSLWVEDIGNVGTSNIAAVYTNPTVGSKIVRIAVGQNGGAGGPNLWDFGADGNLTLPTFDSSASPLISSGITFGDGTYQYTASIAGATGPTGYTGSTGDTGLGFAIAKTYAKVAALTADTAPTSITAGQFALIDTGNVEDAENAKLYLWSGNVYTYVTDLSGSAGITGQTGATGVVGYVGSQGVTGYTGSKGDIGYTGSQGNIGYTGSQGIQGNIGYTGSEGIQGNIGYTGSQGTIGVTGYTGSEGIQGNIGVTGYTGSIGTQGNIGYTGSMSTIASSIATTGSVSTNSAHFLTFVGSNSGTNQSINTASNFTINPSSGLLTTFKVYVNGSTASTSTTTGALVVDGGVGIAGKVFVGGNVTATAATATLTSTAASVGYMGVPQNLQSGNYTFVIEDAGKHILMTASGNLIIPSNSNVPFPVGTTFDIVTYGGTTTTITASPDFIIVAGVGFPAGTRTLSGYGWATLIKIEPTTWIIRGEGLS